MDIAQVVFDDLADNVLASVPDDQVPSLTAAGEVPQHLDPVGGQFGCQQHVLVTELSLERVQSRPDPMWLDAGLAQAVQHVCLGQRDEGDGKAIVAGVADVQ